MSSGIRERGLFWEGFASGPTIPTKLRNGFSTFLSA